MTIPSDVLKRFEQGTVIPAHPLALDQNRKFDTKHQNALTRYYLDAGVGGLAVGVHTTQFEIRDPNIALFEPVLQLASQTIDDYCRKNNLPMICKIAGVCGLTGQAVKEANFAKQAGYHACLLSLAALSDRTDQQRINHCREIAQIMPIIGFYLQPAVGGSILSYDFWRRFAEIENVIGIKIAPFNRYQTIDVVRAVCHCDRQSAITLYTGNDDNIVVDLLTEYRFETPSGTRRIGIKGGLLGHWAVWTRAAVQMLEQIHQLIEQNTITPEILTLAAAVTDANAAFFDVANSFKGCIAGIHEVLRRQSLLPGIWCLNPKETLSPGQLAQIDRVCQQYHHLSDDAFIQENLHKWLKG